jgi:hypothetical protein
MRAQRETGFKTAHLLTQNFAILASGILIGMSEGLGAKPAVARRKARPPAAAKSKAKPAPRGEVKTAAKRVTAKAGKRATATAAPSGKRPAAKTAKRPGTAKRGQSAR